MIEQPNESEIKEMFNNKKEDLIDRDLIIIWDEKNKEYKGIDEIKKKYCKLLHSQIPKMTDKMIWDENNKEWKREIIWICKEGSKTIFI